MGKAEAETEARREWRLSNGRYSVLLTAAGGGYSAWNDYALTGRSADPIEGAGGLFVYFRDLDTGSVWSAGREPRRAPSEFYDAREESGAVVLTRAGEGIETSMAVLVDAIEDVEFRRLRVRNLSGRPRRIELTTYTEIVLNRLEAHAAHPAFGKLFVQTAFVEEIGALVAHRRPRSAAERHPWLMHALLGGGALEFATDRARFIGRWRTAAAPAALASTAPLPETAGSVLDPVFSLRRVARLAPGAEEEFTILLGVAPSREAAVALARRLGARAREPHVPAPPAAAAATAASGGGDLLFFNGHGGFAPNGCEYVIRLAPGGEPPPMPWINVIANERFGFLVSERGAGCTWSRNSRQNRLTPWHNDPVSDPHGEALYLRDEETGELWSPQPGPAPGPGAYEVAHGFGYSRWRHESGALAQEVVQFVPCRDPVKITHVRLTNTGDRPRRLSLVAYQRLVLGVLPAETAAHVRTDFDAATGVLRARNPDNGEFSDGVVFAAMALPEGAVRWTADGRAFVGRDGSTEAPAALRGAAGLDGSAGSATEPCLALQAAVAVPPGGTVSCAILFGEAQGEDAAGALVERYRRPGACEAALGEVRAFWREVLTAVRVETPSAPLNLMMNGWLLYQTLSCRLWGRSAFYQSGGAFGFRDQLQDAAAMVYSRPDLTRAQIVLHAAHQFVEGDALHWWHPPGDCGTRTRCSDDLLWLPLATAFYVRVTGDWSVLDEAADFVVGRSLDPGEDEAYLPARPAGAAAGVYEHCCRALDRSLTAGAHGLPLMGTCDWNDGMNRVGREGRGESVWLGFFLYRLIDDFAPICERRGDLDRARRYRAYRERLRAALNEGGWDGRWYRRAYYDDGSPLGSAANDECRIDALAQAWAVISGAAPPERAAAAMRAVDEMLLASEAGIVRLLAPPFDREPRDPGYIKGYAPGIRENGGQYTHAALWVVQALAELGRRDRAAALLEMLTPVAQARTPERAAVYRVEPYAVAADIYGVAPHLGRGGWTWYTGSAGWMYRVAAESILGLRLEGGDTLSLKPCIPDEWPEFTVRLRLPGGAGSYEISVRNPAGCAAAVTSVTVDGRPGCLEGGAARIVLARDGAAHRVGVELGPAPGSP